MFQIRLGS
jgi:hypothetical protein